MAEPKNTINQISTQNAIKSSDTKLNDINAIFQKYKDRINKFEEDICEFPVVSNNIISNDWKQYKSETVEHMTSCYPLVHGSLISLAYDFLLIKRQYGTEIEKAVYLNMTLCEFFDRLATKRCVVFYQSYDSYLLRNGYNDSGKWEYIGTPNEEKTDKYDVTPEKKPRLIEYLSYDELLLSALCGISSLTHFINNGDRRNCGRIKSINNVNNDGNHDIYPMNGIYMGLVGARFEKSNYMEYSLMVITNHQNKLQNGYGKYINNHQEEKEKEKEKEEEKKLEEKQSLIDKVNKSSNIKNTKIIWRAFEKFYSREYFPTYDEVNTNFASTSKYYKKDGWGGINNNQYLDCDMFKQRIRVSLELFLFDADKRGKDFNKCVYCHVVGLGTGVWSFKKSIQDSIIVSTTKDIIESTLLSNISCIYFSWMDEDCMFENTNTNTTNNNQKQPIFNNNICKDVSNKHIIYIDSGRRAPADKLPDKFSNCLIAAMYAWDSNSFPGNEYYHGMLSASGDPAAASCSTISFVQNSEINKEYISGKNTTVYFYDKKNSSYQFCKFKDIDFEKNKEKWLKKSIESKRT